MDARKKILIARSQEGVIRRNGIVTHVKVTAFPSKGTHNGIEISFESMWVRLLEGEEDINAGLGILDNKPAYDCPASYGDLVEFGGGDEDNKPSFIRVAEKAVG